VPEDRLPKTVSTVTMVDLLGQSQQYITHLTRRGVLVRAGRGKFEFAQSDLAVPGRLTRGDQRRCGENIAKQAATERMRLAKEQADVLALRNAALRRTLLDAAAVEREWLDILRGVRAGILAVPSRVGARLPHLTT
jgi:terminase small subunit / prophage DNA-packing protein